MKVARVNARRDPILSSFSGVGGGTPAPALDDLTDVDTSGVGIGDVIVWNGSEWVPGTGGSGGFPWWFNVEDYGAVHDGSTDDTPAIQDTIDACFAAGGGTVFFPNGIYAIKGALQATSTYNSQLTIPNNPFSGTTPPIAIAFLGMGAVAQSNDGPSIAMLPSLSGAILLSDWNGTITGDPAVIAGGLRNAIAPSGDFNWVMVEFHNIEIRCHADPKLSALQMTSVARCQTDHVTISTDIASASASVPTHANATGIDMPRGLNSNFGDQFDTTFVDGYYTGVKLSEQSTGVSLAVAHCTRGVEVVGGIGSPAYFRHAINLGRLLVFSCPRGIVFSGDQTWLTIDLMNIEHDASPWTAVYDIDDANNYGRGFIGWHTTDYTTGPVDDLLVNGGEGLSLHGLFAERWKLTNVVHIPQIGTNPATDPDTGRFLYSDDTTEHLTVRKPDGSDVDLEAGGVSDITDLPTAETDTTLVLVPDGAGGVEWGSIEDSGRWELAVIPGSPPDPLYAGGDFLYIFVP